MWDQFWSQSHDLNKFESGLKVMLHTKYRWFQTRIHYGSQCKICDPRSGPFLPQNHNLNKLGRDIVKITHSVYYMYGVQKTTNDAIIFSYHFLLSDAQPDYSGTFHQDFSHITQAG